MAPADEAAIRGDLEEQITADHHHSAAGSSGVLAWTVLAGHRRKVSFVSLTGHEPGGAEFVQPDHPSVRDRPADTTDLGDRRQKVGDDVSVGCHQHVTRGTACPVDQGIRLPPPATNLSADHHLELGVSLGVPATQPLPCPFTMFTAAPPGDDHRHAHV